MKNETTLSPNEIQERLSNLNGWEKDGIKIGKTFVFENFKEINVFLPYLTNTIVDQNHHPDFTFDTSTKSVKLTISTHSAEAITDLDLKTS